MAITVEEYRERLKQILEKAQQAKTEEIIIPAANAMLAAIKNRISRDGKASDGSLIGSYSTKPAYFSKKSFNKKAAFKPQGKSGFTGQKIVSAKQYRVVKVKLKSGKIVERIVEEKKLKIVKHIPKSMYLEDGYFQFRGIQGLDNGKVNLFYTGDLLASYVLRSNSQGVYLGFDKEKQSELRKVLEDKKYKKKIFNASPQEIEEYNKEVAQALSEITKI